MKLSWIGRTLIAAAVLSGGSAAAARAALPFVEDDYSRAMAQARSRRLPVFVEAWAPW